MPPLVVALVLLAAALHVAWNVILKTSGDPLRSAFVGVIAGAVVAVPVGAGVLVASGASIAPPVVALAAASGLVEMVYFVLLSRAYRHGDLSVVYPTARGTAPVVAVAIGVLVLGERLGPVGAVGVAALLAGILVLQRPWRLLLRAEVDPAARVAASAAMATGVAIAVYSALDTAAVQRLPALAYAALLWPAIVGGLALWLGVDRLRREVRPTGGSVGSAGPDASAGHDASAGADAPIDVPVARAVAGGLLTYVAYALVLVALTMAPLTAVAPLRESAVVVAAGWGAVRLGEARDRRDLARRLLAAGLVVVGVLLLVLDPG